MLGGPYNSVTYWDLVAFNIQGPDAVPQMSHHNSAAPTRPPSRTNNRSPMGKLVESMFREAAGIARGTIPKATRSYMQN